jgi:DNA-binding transcriptional MerR regulator
MIDGFTTELAARLTGVTTEVLENWSRSKFLRPSVPAPRRGVSATYSFQDVVAIRVACSLRDEGISLQSLRKVVAFLCSEKGLKSTTEALSSSQLITDGRDVFKVVDVGKAVGKAIILSALRKPGQRMLLIVPLGEHVTELKAKARAIHAA